MNAKRLIKIAQNKLLKSPFDAGHDLVHHYKVWENCFEIISAEGLNDIDSDSLQVAAWFHDVDKGLNQPETFLNIAKEENLTEGEIGKILEIINSHSFEDERSSVLEAKVLFDADKVEYVGYSRWLHLTISIANNELPLLAGIKYAEALNSRMEYIVSNLNFQTSRVMMKRNIDALVFLNSKNMFTKEVASKIDWGLLKRLIV